MLRVENRISAHAQVQHCCTNLAKRPQHHATFKNVAWKIWPFSNFSQQHPKCRNMSQHVAKGWPNARNMLHPIMLWYVALKCCDRLAGALRVSPKSSFSIVLLNWSTVSSSLGGAAAFKMSINSLSSAWCLDLLLLLLFFFFPFPPFFSFSLFLNDALNDGNQQYTLDVRSRGKQLVLFSREGN